MTRPLAGCCAIVTGASRGIGAATAVAIGAAGGDVCLMARSEPDLRRVAAEVVSVGSRAVVVVGDAANAADVDRLYEEAQVAFGRLDIVVNNAGRGIFGNVVDGDIADWRAMLELNLFGLMYSCKLAATRMVEQGHGTIVNVSSLGAHRAYPGFAVYHATKFGVNGFSEALRLELLAAGIRVLIVEPGATNTAWGEKMPPGSTRGKAELSPVDIANAIVYALRQPPHVAVTNVLVRPTGQR